MSAAYTSPAAAPKATATVFAQVMILVAVALGICAAGTVIGGDLQQSTARICSFAGLGMLLVQAFVPALRHGPLGIGWLGALALLIGLGIGPLIGYVAEVDPDALTTAFAGTALTVTGMAMLGFTISRDLSGWMRPLCMIVLAAVAVSIVGLAAGGLGPLSPVVSIGIFLASAALIAVDFNYIREHGNEHDVIWLATGIFVSVFNIFISLLELIFRD